MNLVFAFLVCVFYFWSFIFGFSAYAQGQAGTDIATLKAGVGARPLGMGGAFTAVADNADAPYWNPAGLAGIRHNEITTMQTKLSTDANHYYISYVQPALGGTLGLSWIQVGLGNITHTSSEVDVHNEVQNLSIFSYFSNAYLFSYGREFNDMFSIGLTAKYLTSDMFQIAGGQAYGYSVTPGILIRLRPSVAVAKGESLYGKRKTSASRPTRSDSLNTTAQRNMLTIGLKIDELLNQQQWGTGTVEKVPPKLRLGLAYKSPNPGLFALDISQILKSGYASEVSMGYEWNQDGLSLRMGYVDGTMTAGVGFVSGYARVDYAYVTQPTLSKENVHRISLSGVW